MYGPQFNLTNCFECPKGYYQNEEGQITCKKCPNGTISKQSGSSECEECPKGYWQTKKRDFCMTCKNKQERSSFGCYYCKPGYYKNSTVNIVKKYHLKNTYQNLLFHWNKRI